MQRRDCLKFLAGAALLPRLHTFAQPAIDLHLTPEPYPRYLLTPDDEAFLDDLERRACHFFVEQASPTTGQVLDRAAAIHTPLNLPAPLDPRRMASTAATGFGLTALCIADKRRYFPRAQIIQQVRRTLRFHAHKLPNVHGFFYHFNDIETGERIDHNEVSSIDTALLLCGILTARAWFHHDREIVHLANLIYNRVDWPWMLNGPLDGTTAFSMGWHPETGFIEARWSRYCELMMIYLLAIGSPTHRIPASSWDAWKRQTITYDGLTYISGNDPLFTHQYSHAWFDFRNKRDRYADYFANSISATRAHEAFCLARGKPYSPDYWGISASDYIHGYVAWGGPDFDGKGFGPIDGSVVPNATAGSLPFLPEACLRVQRALKSNYGDKAYGRYGFCDAFHPQANYYDPDVLGIDLGIGLVMAENLRTSFVWDTFARNPEVTLAMRRAGFHRA